MKFDIELCLANNEDYYNCVYEMLSDARTYYPGFREWYWGKVIPGIASSERIILTVCEVKTGEIIGVSILKASAEKKICTFFVKEGYRNSGVGTALMCKSLEYLDYRLPLLTVPEEADDMFGKFVKRFGFKSRMVYYDYYRDGKKERSYNGYLIEDDKVVFLGVAA